MRFAPFALPGPALDARLDKLRWTFRKWDTHVRGRSTVARGALVLGAEEHASFAGARRVGFVYATAYAEDLQVVRLLADLLEMHGFETVLASPAHLAEDGRLAGEPVDVIHRFFPGEWFPELPNLAAWEAAVASG